MQNRLSNEFLLDNFQTIFINGKSQLFYLVPFEKLIWSELHQDLYGSESIPFNVHDYYDQEGKIFSTAEDNKGLLSSTEECILCLEENLKNYLNNIHEQLFNSNADNQIINTEQFNTLFNKLHEMSCTEENELMLELWKLIGEKNSLLPEKEIKKLSKQVKYLKDYIHQEKRKLDSIKSNIITTDHSISQFSDTIKENGHVYADIGNCFFVVCKSTLTNRYWLLHYDPKQTYRNENQYKRRSYTRANYCDLNPNIPYDNKEIQLQDDEQIDVLVVLPDEKVNPQGRKDVDSFVQDEFLHRLGKEKVNSIQCIQVNSLICYGFVLHIEFFPTEDQIVLSRISVNDMKEIHKKNNSVQRTPIYNSKNCFNCNTADNVKKVIYQFNQKESEINHSNSNTFSIKLIKK